MQQQKFYIRLIGILVIIFATIHLFLNLYIISLGFILKSNEIQKLMHTLAQTFGPIAIQENRNIAVLSIKVTASALFLTSGIGLIILKEWARKLLFCILGLRIIYALTICIILNIFHPHFAIILAVGLLLFYYLNLPSIKRVFS